MTMRRKILEYMALVPGGDAQSISEDLGFDYGAVQSLLHSMDDDGDLIMSIGWYRISEAARLRLAVQV